MFDWNIYGNLDVGQTGIDEAETENLHKLVEINVYPNPFRQMTEIRYQVPDIQMQDVRNNLSTSLGTGMQDISLKIYDVSGRIVKVFNLTSGFLLPASTVSWDGTDNDGKKVPSGVYFCKLTTGDYSTMKKLLLVR